VSRYQKGKTNLDFTEARDSEWQWHQLGHMLVCTSLQTDSEWQWNPLYAPRSRQITMPAPHCSVFTGRMPFMSPNQQHQSTEGIKINVMQKFNLISMQLYGQCKQLTQNLYF